MILLVDNYDSFTYNLAQYIGSFTDVQVLRNDDNRLEKVAEKAAGIVFSPGPGWPNEAGKMEELIKSYAGKKPILGICLGHQAIAEVFGGQLKLAKKVMHGKQSQMTVERPSPIFSGLEKKINVMRYHSIAIKEMPPHFNIVSRTDDDHEIMAIQHHDLAIYGLQYHPESIGTEEGMTMIQNFISLTKER